MLVYNPIELLTDAIKKGMSLRLFNQTEHVIVLKNQVNIHSGSHCDAETFFFGIQNILESANTNITELKAELKKKCEKLEHAGNCYKNLGEIYESYRKAAEELQKKYDELLQLAGFSFFDMLFQEHEKNRNKTTTVGIATKTIAAMLVKKHKNTMFVTCPDCNEDFDVFIGQIGMMCDCNKIMVNLDWSEIPPSMLKQQQFLDIPTIKNPTNKIGI